MSNFAINPPSVAIVNPATGKPTAEGYKFFLAIQRTIGDGLLTQIQEANYLTFSSSAVLSNSLVLTAGTGISLSTAAGNRTVAITSAVVTLTGTQTLTNKTLTSPAISGGAANNMTIGGITPREGAFTSLQATEMVSLPSYDVASLPDPTVYTTGFVFVSDEAGGPVPAFSDGTNWRRVTDRTIVS